MAERDAKIYQLRLANLTERQIAAEVGISPTHVHRILTEQAAEIVKAPAEEYAAEREAELQDLYRKSYRLAISSTDENVRIKALLACARFNESRRKLRGADAVQPQEITLKHQAELDSKLVATAIEAVTVGVMAALGDAVDTAFAERLKIYAYELAAYELERADGADPGPAPEPPKAQLALPPGSASAPSDGPEDDGPTSGPHSRLRDAADTILAQVDRILMEDDDDEDDEDDQG
ncbi:hypothetical protein ACWCQW_47370 [Streptomyces mirabilis]